MAGINIKELTGKDQRSTEIETGSERSFILKLLNYDIKFFGKSYSDKKKEKFWGGAGGGSRKTVRAGKRRY